VASVSGAVGSVTGAVGSVTGAVGSVAGNVDGNVSGSVASVATGGITAGSIAADAIGASELAADAVAEIADAVWDEAIAGHAGVGSTGEQLAAAGAAGDPWATALPGAYGAGTAGKIVGDNIDAPLSTIDTVVDGIQTDLSNGTDGLGAIKTDTAAILVDTADIQPKIGTPAADISADIAAVKVDTAATLVDTGTTLPGLLPAALVGGRIDANMGAISGDATAADNLEESATTIVFNTAKAGTLTTTAMSTNLTEATDDHYIGRTVIWTTGVLLGQASDITDYVGVNGVLSFTAVTEAPSAADAFVII